jgi:hypothetical protein
MKKSRGPKYSKLACGTPTVIGFGFNVSRWWMELLSIYLNI